MLRPGELLLLRQGHVEELPPLLAVTGELADLVLLDASPLADIGNVGKIRGVMVRGRWLDRATLDARLAEIEKKHAR